MNYEQYKSRIIRILDKKGDNVTKVIAALLKGLILTMYYLYENGYFSESQLNHILNEMEGK